MKLCIRCNVEKEESEFYKNKKLKDGLTTYCKECTLSMCAEYRENNREKKREYQKEYRNRPEIKPLLKEKDKIYKKTHPEKVKAQKQRHRKTESGRQREKKYKLRRKHREKNVVCTLTVQEWNGILEYFNNKCAYCGNDGELFKDHFIPLSKGGELTINNVIPSCKRCNSSKHVRSFEEWYPNQEYYSKEREQKVYKYLNYKDGSQQLSFVI